MLVWNAANFALFDINTDFLHMFSVVVGPRLSQFPHAFFLLRSFKYFTVAQFQILIR